MSISAVEILCGNDPLNKNKVIKISVKLEKGTVKAGIRRHKWRTFDVVVCLEMEDNANKNNGLQLEYHMHIDCHKEIRKSQREKKAT